jgi:hypothetical protein
MTTGDERRTHSRFPFTSRLEVRQRRGGRTPSGEDVQRVARATAIDVSVGGLGFRSSLPLTVGDVISVSLSDAEELANYGLGSESPTGPRPRQTLGMDYSFEIIAIVRHVEKDGGDYFIGAERRGDN